MITVPVVVFIFLNIILNIIFIQTLFLLSSFYSYLSCFSSIQGYLLLFATTINAFALFLRTM
jgi:hypothetical protein